MSTAPPGFAFHLMHHGNADYHPVHLATLKMP
jgi:hypothetical protein